MRLSTRTLLVTLLFCSAALLIGRDHPLQNLNEGLYARLAQEMLERRDFIVPTLDGVPYLEKPPLLYWITAASRGSISSTSICSAFSTPACRTTITPARGGISCRGSCWISFLGHCSCCCPEGALRSPRRCGRREPVYLYGEFESLSAFPFYLDAPVGVVDSRSADLWYGAKLEPHPARFPDAASLQPRATVEPLWLVVPKAARADFARSGLASAFVEERTVGTNDLYASRPLAEQLTRERAPESVANAAPDGGIDATPRRREHGS